MKEIVIGEVDYLLCCEVFGGEVGDELGVGEGGGWQVLQGFCCQ